MVRRVVLACARAVEGQPKLEARAAEGFAAADVKFAFVLVCLGVLVLRYTNPEAHRPFKTPAPHVVCILGALSAAAQMASLPVETWERLLVWMALGLAIYFMYGRKHATLR